MSDPSTDSSPKGDASNCSSCGVELEPQSAPRGLCPRCLMAEAMAETEAPEGDHSTRPEPPNIDAVQAAFPQLKILDLIGVGGMGMVYKARQKSLRRDVALKLLSPHRGDEPGFAERFTREAQALAALNHPNIVTVHDFGEADGFFYLLMEFVDGVNLRQAISNERFTPEQALAIVPPICEALQFAHDRGIVHRDIKPENLLLDKDGRIKVADFGIARILDQDSLPAESSDSQATLDTASPDSAPGLTGDTTLGTPRYMAPEQSEHPEQVDHRADIYSLGVVFYELLTGEAPGGRLTPPSSRVEVDVRLDEIVLRALADSPELRWQTAADLRTQVETIVAEKTSSASAATALADAGPPPLQAAADSAATTPTATAANAPSPSLPPISATPATASTSTATSPSKKTSGCLIAGLIGGGVLLILLVVAFFATRFFSADQATDPAKSAAITATQSDLNVADAERRRARNLLGQHAQQFPNYQQLDTNSRAFREGSALEKDLAEATQREQSLRSQLAQLHQNQPRPMGRLSWIAFLVLVALAAGVAVLLWWSLSRKKWGGCIVLALLALAAPVVLVLLYHSIGVSKTYIEPGAPSPRADGRAASATARYILRRALVQSDTPRDDKQKPSHKFICRFDALEVANGWELWLTLNQSHMVNGKLRSSGSSNSKVDSGGQTTMQLNELSWDNLLYPAVDSELQGLKDRVFTVESGVPASILSVSNSKGETLELSIELRPAPDFSGQPATQLFVRAMDAQPANGNLALAFNEILTVSGFDLVLETNGAVAQFDSRDQLEQASFSAINDPDKKQFSRTIIRQSGALLFSFPAVAEYDATSLLPAVGTSIKIHQDRPWKIFDITDLESGHRAWAQLQLVPKETTEEVHSPKSASSPPAIDVDNASSTWPGGALFTIMGGVAAPGGSTLHVQGILRHQDNEESDQALGSAMTVRLPATESRVMTELMFAVYPDSHPTHPNGFLIAFRDKETDKFLHIIEGKFPAPVVATGIDMPRSEHWNEAETLKFTYLDEPQSPTIRRLFQGTQVEVPGTSESNWWDVFLRMEYKDADAGADAEAEANGQAEEKTNQQPAPGTPHPPAPQGAAFVSDQRIIVPGDAKLRVDAYFRHRDNRGEETSVGNALIFKTPNNDARGFFVRWHYYEAASPKEAGRFLIDFEVAATGMIFHRIEGTMPRAQLLVTSKENQASERQSTQIDRNGSRYLLSLMHARHPADANASATDWWDLHCSIEWVNFKEKDAEPAFQLPPSPSSR